MISYKYINYVTFISCSVHAKMEEKINVSCNRDGGLESMEVSGMLTLRISDEQLARVRLALHNPSKIPDFDTELNNKTF